MEAAAASMEVWVLGWSAALLVAQIFLQAGSAGDRGPTYLLGARDEARTTRSVLAGRFDRALRNFLETYPAFIALAVALVFTGKTGGIAETGAIIWLVARIVYVVLYAAGVPMVRSVIWFVSLVGLAMMFIRLMF